MSDPALFDATYLTAPSEAEQAFTRFHEANPSVYTELVTMAHELHGAGRDRIGVGMLFEILRWQRWREYPGDDFKLNNNYRAWYARLIMQEEPELDGIFQLREQTT